ncbi:hypothetical protein VTK56DRAFT_9009 [Thermocarpiscus australiensis]
MCPIHHTAIYLTALYGCSHFIACTVPVSTCGLNMTLACRHRRLWSHPLGCTWRFLPGQETRLDNVVLVSEGQLIVPGGGQGTCPVESDWSPWSHRPLCLEPAEGDDRLSADCVFTLTTFRGNQGISVITTPNLAASIVDDLDDSGLSPGLRERLSDSMKSTKTDGRRMKIQYLPGHGKEMVARRRFKKIRDYHDRLPCFDIPAGLHQ